MPQTSGGFPPAYSNFVTGAKKKKTKANPFPMAAAIKRAAAGRVPPLPPLRTKTARTPAQDKAIFAKTKGRGR